jgi:hypothetical protein
MLHTDKAVSTQRKGVSGTHATEAAKLPLELQGDRRPPAAQRLRPRRGFRSTIPIFLFSVGYYHVPVWDLYMTRIWAARRLLADLSWRRAVELATDSREAAPRQGAR